MKKVLAIVLLSAISAFGAADNVIVKGVDYTALTGISPTSLNNLVDLATLAANRGVVIAQTTTPDTSTYPVMTNYLWLDLNTDPGIVKAYRAASNDWVAASVGVGAVTTSEILDGTIAAVDIGTGAVASDELAALSVSTAKIQALAVTTSELAASSVTTTKILDATIALVDMADNSVNSAKIVDASIATVDIAALAIDNTLLAVGSVQSNSIALNSVAQNHVQANAIQSTNIVDGSIATNDVAFVTPFVFDSGTNNAYTVDSLLNVAHSLGARPQIVNVYLVCGTADLNYSVGDEILINSEYNSTASDRGITVLVDGTNVGILTGQAVDIINKTSFNSGIVDPTKWSFRVTAITFQ